MKSPSPQPFPIMGRETKRNVERDKTETNKTPSLSQAGWHPSPLWGRAGERVFNKVMKVAIIDNYDSFTYNLSHLVKELGADVTVFRNDQFQMEQLEAFDKIILSPGPGIPSEAGLLLDVIKAYAGKKPILGVCLGHQAIGESFGGTLTNLSEVYHGVATPATITTDDYLFEGLPQRIEVGRYHSWVVAESGLPACLEVTSVSDEGYIMSLRHKEFDIRGIQYHPESVLTKDGKTIINNWLKH